MADDRLLNAFAGEGKPETSSFIHHGNRSGFISISNRYVRRQGGKSLDRR
jgi:hypothetical protein